MVDLKVAAGREVIKTDYDLVIEMLEEKLIALKSGDMSANRMCLILTDAKVDKFTQNISYKGRVSEILGLNEIAKVELLQETGVL
jgi:hypothetical protein